jgi:hypothetical protein
MKKRVVHYNDANWFAGLLSDHITALTVHDVPAEDTSGNWVPVQFLVLPEYCQWPSFLDMKQEKACGRRVVLEKKCIRYPAITCQMQSDADIATVPPDDGTIQEEHEYAAGRDYDECSEDDCLELDDLGLYPANDVPRFAARRLLQKNPVIFVGHSGVGKSVEVNIVLYHLLHELAGRNESPFWEGTGGKLKKVFLRIELCLFRFAVSDENVICCEEIPDCGKDLRLLDLYFKRYPRPQRDKAVADDAILILEIHPGEQAPHITRVPVLIAVSSRDVEKELTSMIRKDDEGCDLVVRPPHSHEELIALSLALYQTDGSDYLERIGLQVSQDSGSSSCYSASSSSLSSSEIERRHKLCELIRGRIQVIGPLAREVLNSERIYKRWMKSSQQVNTADKFLETLNETDALKLPSKAMYLVAPYSINSIRFLSEACSKLVSKVVQTQHIEVLARHRLDWQIAEAVVLNCFVMKINGTPAPFHWDCTQWEFYKNPEHNHYLGAKDLVSGPIKDDIIASSTGHTRKVYFGRSHLPLACEHLVADTVYLLSTMATMPVGRYLTYAKETNCLTLYQTSTIDPAKHLFTLRSLQRYSQNGKVNIRILYFVSWHTEKVTGVRIIPSAKETVKTLSDDEVCRQIYGPEGAGRYSAYIVRCGIYDSSKVPTILLAAETNEMSLFETYVHIWNSHNDEVGLHVSEFFVHVILYAVSFEELC